MLLFIKKCEATKAEGGRSLHQIALAAFLVFGKELCNVSERFNIDFGLKTGLNKGEAGYALLAGVTCSLRRNYHAYG